MNKEMSEVISRIIFISGLLIIFLISLIFEYLCLNRTRKRVKWRLAIGGVRGKSSVARLIAGALSEAGFKVLARTTGSSPQVIFPDGHEEVIKRIGTANILEGKKFFNLVRQEKVDAIVVELMAIKPECLEIEIKKIFQPHCLILTNFRPDHVAELGYSREEVARNLLRSMDRGSTLFLLEEEILPEIKPILREKKVNLISVPPLKEFALEEDHVKELREVSPQILRAKLGDDFMDNIRLALAVARYLGIEDKIAFSGMRKIKPDMGSLKIWQINLGKRSLGYVASAFAANDPFSSALTIRKIREIIPLEWKNIYGLLLFRRDRGDRTWQWLKAIKEGFFDGFTGLFLYNCPSWSLIFIRKKMAKRNFLGQKSKLCPFSMDDSKETDQRCQGRERKRREKNLSIYPEIKKLKKKEVLSLVETLSQEKSEPWVLIGLGNIVGLGAQLVNLWEKIGKRIHG